MPISPRDLQEFRDVWALRIFGLVASTLLLLSFIFCVMKGHTNGYNYFLAINALITAFIGGLITKWYNVGELSVSKLWFMLSYGCLIIVQSVVYDVFAFHTPRNHTAV